MIRQIPCKECAIVRIAFKAHIFLKVNNDPYYFSSLFKHKMQVISINLSLA